MIAILIICLFLFTVNTLPIQNTKSLQITFYQDKLKTFDFSDTANLKNWYQSEEYNMYASMVDYYENLVDSTLSSESEELLIDLIHLPKTSMNQLLDLQANMIGLDSLTERQRLKMPSIIGKHIQQMNVQLFESIEKVMMLHWSTFWDPALFNTKEKDALLSFLSTFNGIVAKRLMDEMDAYDLLGNIKQDILHVSGTTKLAWAQSFIHTLFASTKPPIASDMDIDFLRQHVANIRTSLLMELHIQFMDFYARIQSDILDQLSTYYN